MHLYGRLTYSVSTCLHCYSRGTVVKNVYIRLNPIDNHPAILVLKNNVISVKLAEKLGQLIVCAVCNNN